MSRNSKERDYHEDGDTTNISKMVILANIELFFTSSRNGRAIFQVRVTLPTKDEKEMLRVHREAHCAPVDLSARSKRRRTRI